MSRKGSLSTLLSDVDKLKTKPEADLNKRISQSSIKTSDELDNLIDSVEEDVKDADEEIDWSSMQIGSPKQTNEVVSIDFGDTELLEDNSDKSDLHIIGFGEESSELNEPKVESSKDVMEISFEQEDVEPTVEDGNHEQLIVEKPREVKLTDEIQIDLDGSDMSYPLHKTTEEETPQELASITIEEPEEVKVTEEIEIDLDDIKESYQVAKSEPTAQEDVIDITEGYITKSSNGMSAQDIISNIEHSAELEFSGLCNALENIKKAYEDAPIKDVVELQQPTINEDLLKEKIKEHEDEIIKNHEEKRSKEIQTSISKSLEDAKKILQSETKEDVEKEMSDFLNEFSLEDNTEVKAEDYLDDSVTKAMQSAQEELDTQLEEPVQKLEDTSPKVTFEENTSMSDMLSKLSLQIKEVKSNKKHAETLKQLLVQALKEDKYYVQYDEEVPASTLGDNISKKEIDGKTYYYYTSIPTEYSSLRKSAEEFLQQFSQELIYSLEVGKSMEYRLYKEFEVMPILTEQEMKQIEDFLVYNEIEYSIIHNGYTLYIPLKN